MADRRRRPDRPPYSENGVRYDLLCDPKLTTDVQRHVSRVFERDTEHRALLTRIAMLTETLAADPSKLVVLQRLLARIEKVTDSKLEMLRSVNDMVGDLVQRCRVADGRPSSAASSSSEPEKPREAAACRRSSDDGHVQGAPVAKYTPQPTVSGTVHVNSLRKRVSKPVAKRTVPRKAKRRRVIRKKHKYSRYDDDDDDDDDSSSSSSSSNSNSSSSYDEPEDPNEPTYCLCDRVSFGKMICCDNDLCPIEWFHFRCISMTSKPKGKWFCPNCRGLRSNVMKPREQILKELKIYNEQKER